MDEKESQNTRSRVSSIAAGSGSAGPKHDSGIGQMNEKSSNPSLPNDFLKWINPQLFAAIPLGIAVIGPDYNLVYANNAFEELFGPWKNRKCFSVYKSKKEMCSECDSELTFKDGVSRVNEEVGYEVQQGTILKEIADFASKEENNINFVVMGTHGMKGGQKIFGRWELKVVYG